MTTAPVKIEPKKLTSQEVRELRRAEALRANLIKRKQWQQAQAAMLQENNTENTSLTATGSTSTTIKG